MTDIICVNNHGSNPTGVRVAFGEIIQNSSFNEEYGEGANYFNNIKFN